MDWKKNAAVKASVLDRILKKMLEKEIPAQLVDLVNNISMISSKDIEVFIIRPLQPPPTQSHYDD